jgi:hypothetical protein
MILPALLAEIAAKLEPLGLNYAFVGYSVVGPPLVGGRSVVGARLVRARVRPRRAAFQAAWFAGRAAPSA